MKHLYKVKNNRISGKANRGFTLVEMIVVLTIMAIMMSGAVWGVTGWIAHYEYISSEQKARTIYMAAQSALSAAESRGTLEDYMSDLNKTGEIVKFAKNPGDPGLDKATYGIPTNPDNEDEIHEYGYLSVSQGEYASGANKALFDMLEPYVSDSEQLNASIVVEFDLTAKKVYSAFYSAWSKSIQYDATASCVERGDFYINADRRKPKFLENFQVGYYDADQVNVVKLDNLPQLKADCMLHNEETLYLTMSSDDDNAEEYVKYTVSLYEDPKPIVSSGSGLFGMFGAGDSGSDTNDNTDGGLTKGDNGDGTVTGLGTEKRLCNIYFEKADLEYSESDNGIPKPRDLSVDIFDPAGNKIKGTYPFIISFKKYKDDKGEDQEYFSLTLDAPTTAQSYAMLNSKVDKVTQRTDSNSYSITRLIGTKPMNIYARVSVEPTMAGVYSSGSPKDSNTENALFETKKKEYKDNEYFKDDSAYLISKNRHFTNIKYTEDYIESADAGYTYAMVNDLDWNNVQIYDLTNNLTDPSSEEGYTYVDMTKENKASFPMISKLNKNSEINGCGYQYSNLILNNSSSVIYSHDNDGKLVLGTGLSNTAKTLGVIGTNKGKIRRLIVANTKVNALSYDLYSKTPTGSGTDEATRHALCTDSLEAVGLLCGRNEGSIREIYFDKDCAVKAYVFANLDDVEEAEADGMSDSDIAGDKYINERYACGVGMVAGTVVLDDRTVIDRIRTSGKVEGTITGTDDNFKETPEISDQEERAEIYDDSGIGTAGRITNAQYYSYGVGGVFGYVFGKYDKDADSLGMGVPQKTVADNNKCEPEDEGYYYPLKNRVEKKKKVIDDEGNEKEVTTLVEGDILLFDEDDTRSIINKADVKGVSFTGGIAGNIFIQGLSDNMQKERDKDEDIKIPDKALTQFVNCHNYGDTVGKDFIGGVVGINGRGGYIAECSSYGSPQATKGVSAGITSENYGYISECLVDRAPADEDNANDENVLEPYIPIVKGNMQVAGAITSVNHVDCVVKDCKCAISKIKDENDKDINTTIKISGNEMDTFGYLVGENNGVVNGGKAGDYIGYISKKTRMIIGGAVGTNKKKAVVKNVTVTAKLSDQGEAECIGGVVGLNLSKVNKCKFGGTITKKNCRSADTTVGGVVGRNGDKSLIGADGSSDDVAAVITNSYLIGGELDVSGVCYYSETDSAEQKLARSSAVGGICGANYPDGKIDKCYISCICDVDSDGNALKTDELGNVTSDDNGVYKVKIESAIQVVDGMAGGIVASNYGEVCNSGYTDKVFYDKNDTFEAANDSSYKKYESSNSDKRSKEMSLFVKTLDTLDGVDNADNNTAFNNVTKLNKLFMDDTTGEVLSSVERLKGYLSYDKGKYQYALPKYAQSDVDGSTWDAYQDITNQFHLTMGYKTSGGKDVRGKGCIGGIVGFNSEYGSVNNCASGRWVVENYMPKVTYNATGGVIGNNAADGNRVRNLANFAYVRIELPQIVSEYLTDGIESNKGPDNRFHYVGGVIGTQYNKKETNWSVTKCINAGTVLNYYGHNTGGVVGVVSGMGGVVKNCYNYGTTMTGYATSINGSKSGTAGGIVSHYTDLNPDQTSEILDCQNHGIIAFPVQGLDYETNVVRNGRAVLTANDTGGIVGEISAPDSTKLYTVNIKNCVNGKNARVYAYSKCAGIVGQIGCLTKDYVNNDFMVNSIYVNIDTCRNYASNFWTSENKKKVEGESFAVLAGGISAGRDMYSGTDESKWTGYTTIRNCFSVRMSGNKDSGNYPAIDSNGVVVYSKNDKNPYTQSKAPKFRTFKYCGDNYYLDESSFQYSKRGLILSDGYNEYTYAKRDGDDIVKGDSVKVNAKISYTDSSINNKSTVSLNGTIKSAIINKINSLSLYIDNYDEQYFASDRIISVEYEKSGVRKYALMIEPPYIKAEQLNETNTWISADEKTVFVNVKKDDKVEAHKFAVLYTFEEKDSPNKNASYSVNSINYFKYANMKKANDSSINNTRLPVADEYDVDYYALDKNFLSYIEDQKSKGPDNVIDVNVTEDNTYGYYKVQWDVTNSKKKASATEFDVKVNYYRINKDDEFDKDSLGTYEVVYEAPVKKAYGTTTTVETLKDDYFVDEDLYDYYVVVKVKDSRGKSDSWYSEIEDKTTPKEIKSYRILKKKMPKPRFEIVKYSYKTGTNEANNNNDQYASKWFLHLKNAEDYQKYALTAGLEVGAYQKNDKSEQNLSKTVSLSASDMFDASGNLNLSNILNAAVDINGKFDKDKLDVKLYGYAKADGYLPSDTAEFTIYMPQYADPKIKYSYTFTEEDKETLNNPDKKPEYTGSLTYEYFHESVSKYTPLTEQIFKLELYGVMKEIDQVTGEVKTWHETLASKEYPMSMGDEAKEINIGYYDMTSEVLASLSKYDSFGIDCWYARPGAYDIYNYFETTDNYPQVTEKRGDKTVRSSGYINDVSEDKTVYYFRSCKLPAPTIKYVCTDRTPTWYAVVTNADQYAPGTRIYRDNNTLMLTINSETKNKTGNYAIDSIYDYAAVIPTKWENYYTYKAVSEGNLPSDSLHVTPSKKQLYMPDNNLLGSTSVNLYAESDTFTVAPDETDKTYNKLTYKGRIKYNSRNDMTQYYRYEIYATDKKTGETVTLYMSKDEPMDSGPQKATDVYSHYKDVDISVGGKDSNINIDDYTDFHFAVWYAKASVNTQEADKDIFMWQYCEMSEEDAKSDTFGCFQNGKFINARNKGLIVDVSEGVDAPKYYYASPLADKTYADTTTATNNKKYYVLYREDSNTVSSVKKMGDGVTDDIQAVTDGKVKYVEWSMYPTYYSSDGSDIECDIHVRLYRVGKGVVPTAADLVDVTEEEVNGKKKVYDNIDNLDQGTSHYKVSLPTKVSKQLDWDNYDYYVLVRVKDKDVLSDSAYTNPICFLMNKPLPVPEVSVNICGYPGDVVQLDNVSDYEGYDIENVKIYVEVEGKQKNADVPYEISLDPAKGGKLKNRLGSVQIPYLALMEKYNNANGSKLKLVAYAVEKDSDGQVVERSADFKASVYIPAKGSPVADGTKYELSDTVYTVNKETNTVNFRTKLTYTNTTAECPEDAQGFAVALIGKPIGKIEGKYDNPVILARTNKDQYTYINAGDTKEINVKLSIPDDIDIEEYDYTNYGIFIWSVYEEEGFVPGTEIEISKDIFDAHHDKTSMTIDYSEGTDSPKYFIERITYLDGNNEMPQDYNKYNRGMIKLQFDPNIE